MNARLGYWVICFVCVFALPIFGAVGPDDGDRSGNFDRREATGAASPFHPERAGAEKTLHERVRGARLDYNERRGTLKFVGSTQGFLTEKHGSGGAVSAAQANAIPATDPDRPIKAFLNEYRRLFGHGAEALSGATKKRDDTNARSGMRTAVWQQTLDGIPIFESLLKANITANGELISIGSDFVSDPAKAADSGSASRQALQVTPTISAAQAIAIAAENIGLKVEPADLKPLEANAQGAEKQQRFAHPLLTDPNVHLVWLPMDAGKMRLAWDVILMDKAAGKMYRVLVDAETGEVLVRRSLTNDISNATYRVFTSDSPSPFSPGWPAPNSAQPPVVARTLVTTPALDTNASPNGWIDDGVNETMGNNVDAHLDLNADDVADLPRPHGSPTRVFDFPMDLAQGPGTYRDAAVTQLFYLCNFMHDKLYALGFTEAAGNFQNNNFGRGGQGNDAVQADVQDGSGTDNANFSTPPDGSAGRMQMYVFTGSTPQRDGDFDAEIVLHEYAHGLSNRLVGGGVGISQWQTGGLGEGWSDFYGLALLSEAGDDVNGCYAAGGYATFMLGGMTTNYYFGIRRYPYTTDMTKNPLTFKDIDPTQASPHSGVPHSPIIGDTANEVHNMGEVWCVTLWEARASLINKYGWAAGNNLMLQLVTDGMKLGPANPNFLQARDAIIQADLVNNGGANKSQLWVAFAKRGMGVSASAPPSSSTTGVVEAFDIPDDLSVTPGAEFSPSGPKAGPFTPSSQTYTLVNTGSTTINWTAATAQNWLTLSQYSGVIAASGSTTVVASVNANADALNGGNYSDTITFTNITSGFSHTRAVTLSVVPPRFLYFDLNTNPGWTRQGEWAFGQPTGAGGTVHGYPDPANGATGSSVFGINLAGDYSVAVGGPFYLTAGPFNFTGMQAVQLQFQRWLNAHVQPYCVEAIEVSSNGTTWTTVFSNSGATGIADSAWTKVRYDISSVADNKSAVYVRWGHSVAATAWAYSGWNINDVEFLAAPIQKLTVSIPASATEGDWSRSGTVSIIPIPTSDFVVTLQSSDTTEIALPATVTIPAGQTSATFPLTFVDDAQIDGSQMALITASAPGYTNGSASIQINDNESAVLSVSLPASAAEGVGTVQGTVNVSAVPDANIVVALTSGDPASATVPATVTIPAGQTSAPFQLSVIDDNKVNGTRNVTLTAHVANWTDGLAAINVLDNESTNLALTLPSQIIEGGTGSGSVSISGVLSSALNVSLNSDVATRLTTPAGVTIPAGATSGTFALVATDNTLTDGARLVAISAGAAGFTGTTGSVNVLDNDPDHFSISPVANPQIRGLPFTATITALDANGAVVPTYTGSPILSGGVPFTPTAAGPFVSGTWTGAITATAFGNNVAFNVNDGSGHMGSSNSFDVTTGPFDHFAWSTIASPQLADNPFAATISAVDAGNNLVTSFSGSAALNSQTVTCSLITGSGTSNWTQPINTFWHDERTQSIYLASEIGQSARLTALSFYVTTVPGQTMNNWTIRMKHTGLASYTSPAWESTGWTTVYQSNETITTTGWVTFVFSTPFDYDGVSNLMVDFSFNNSSWTSPGQCHYSTSSAARTIYYYTDSGYGDPLTWSGTTPTPYTASQITNLQFGTEERTVAITTGATGAFVSGTWTGSLSVPFPATGLQLNASDGLGHTGTSNTFAVNAPVTPGNGTAGTVFSENFESGVLNPTFWTSTGTGPFRTQITTANTPHAGTRHLTMDSSLGSTYARNELTLSVDLDGRTNVVLSFWVKSFGDEADGPPPSPFTGGADFDGVAISADGVTWYEVQALRSVTSAWQQYTVNLDAAIASRGSRYNSAFKIRFNHYDDNPITTDGFAFDDIAITATAITRVGVALPAQATEGVGLLTGTVSLPATQGAPVVVNLKSNAPSKLTVQPSTTVPAGQLTATFTANVLDNVVPDGMKTVAVTGSASGINPGTATIQIFDNDSNTLGLILPVSAIENAGTAQGTLTLATPPSGLIQVNMTSSNTTAAIVPTIVTVQPGQTTAPFTITLVDDNKIDGTQTATITAHVQGWIDGSASMSVLDNETRNLSLALPVVTEGASTSGTVSIPGTLPTAVVVSLASSNTSRLTVPATATIGIGSTSAAFTMTAPNNSFTDGTQKVIVTATASTFVGTSGTAIVLDNDVHHFAFLPIGASQIRGAPFSVSITAQDINSATIPSYSGTASLTASGSAGGVSITPTVATGFVSGTWKGNITANTFATNVLLKANDNLGHTGTSNAFTVGMGAVDHFAWTTIGTPKFIGTPFAATITALDLGNNTVPTFNSAVTLTAGTPARISGTGTALTSTLPLNTYWHDERTQCIYLASELGQAGSIASLALYVTALPGQTMNNWTIRMKHTTLASYATASWDSTGWTTVYQSNETISKTGWVAFKFPTPFAFNGTNNLMIDFSFNNSSWTSAGECRYTTTTATRAIYEYTDSGYGDPLTWTGTTNPSPSTSTQLPNLQLQFTRTQPLTPTSATLTSGTWTGDITLQQSGTGITLRADAAGGVAGDTNTFNVVAPPLLTVTPTNGLIASGTAGGPFSPSSITFTLRNTGGASLNWKSARNAGWLSLSATTGTLAASGSTTVLLSINAIASSLAPGVYTDIVTFTNTTNGGGNTTRPVSLTVRDVAPPTVAVTSPNVTMRPAFTVSGTASDVSGVQSVTVNGNAAATTDGFAHWSALLSNLNVGTNPVTIIARDNASNSTTLNHQVTRLADADIDGLPDTWESAHGLDPSANTGMHGALGDLDNDGIANLLEYAFNLDPQSPDGSGLPTSAIAINPADGKPYLTYSYRRRIDSGGLQYVVEVSGDLGTWSSGASEVEQIGAATPNADGVTETVTLRVKPAIGAGGGRYVRLRVSVQ